MTDRYPLEHRSCGMRERPATNVREREGAANTDPNPVGADCRPSNRMTEIKSAADVTSLRTFEALLRGCGFSNRQARKLAERGWSGMRDADEPDAPLAALLDSALADLRNKT